MHIPIAYPTVGILENPHSKNHYLIALTPQKNATITITKEHQLYSNNRCDSLLNYLQHSNNDFIAQQAPIIINTTNIDSIAKTFKQYKLHRDSIILTNKNNLSYSEQQLLLFQNKARLYAFLFYLGRNVKQLDRHSPYYNFIADFDLNDSYIKTLPEVILYRLEVEYIHANETIESIPSFIGFIRYKVVDKELSDFLVAIYLQKLIEFPSYWQLHTNSLSPLVLQEIVKEEQHNQYLDIIKRSSNAFFRSQKGMIAYNFNALNKTEDTIRLNDFLGKIVFIDTWATWCHPCVQQRPHVLKLAEKYSHRDDIVFLWINVDEKKNDWLLYLTQETNINLGIDLYIKNGIKAAFGNAYNIKSIPRYMIINKEGIIVDSNLSKPSLEAEKILDELLNIPSESTRL